ncbi:PP2C family protein-serine/threonine phosphatase [Streptomyces sp. NPDC046182]|uniref:PP2C family protein-serine/threonine phosphatase n=1 Tax=Streptomyces sp. NPDC046182 TaxID=3154601 RepID=UPI003409A87B
MPRAPGPELVRWPRAPGSSRSGGPGPPGSSRWARVPDPARRHPRRGCHRRRPGPQRRRLRSDGRGPDGSPRPRDPRRGVRPVLSATNRLLVDLDPGLLTSCLYVHVDFARRRVSSQGRAIRRPPAPPDGRTAPVDVSPGPLLGIDPEAVYPVTEIPLFAGQLLLPYTDGLVETPGTDLDDSLAARAGHLSAADDRDLSGLIDTLLVRVRPASRRTDDIALLVLRISDTEGRTSV